MGDITVHGFHCFKGDSPLVVTWWTVPGSNYYFFFKNCNLEGKGFPVFGFKTSKCSQISIHAYIQAHSPHAPSLLLPMNTGLLFFHLTFALSWEAFVLKQ